MSAGRCGVAVEPDGTLAHPDAPGAEPCNVPAVVTVRLWGDAVEEPRTFEQFGFCVEHLSLAHATIAAAKP